MPNQPDVSFMTSSFVMRCEEISDPAARSNVRHARFAADECAHAHDVVMGAMRPVSNAGGGGGLGRGKAGNAWGPPTPGLVLFKRWPKGILPKVLGRRSHG